MAMGETKINITSGVVEKGIDLAKGFLEKVVSPAAEELGLLLKDHVTSWRARNQVSILARSKAYCEKHKISPKLISPKLLVPLLDAASLEDDEKMQDKWATLLGNMVDSEQNVNNNILPYILSQISKSEFAAIAEVVELKLEANQVINKKIDETHLLNVPKIKQIEAEIDRLEEEREITEDPFRLEQITYEISEHEYNKQKLDESIEELFEALERPVTFDEVDVERFEIANLVRLGILKEVTESFATTEPVQIPNSGIEPISSVSFDVGIEANRFHIVTELGEKFIRACSEKTS